MSVNEKMTAIADAIRSKTGKTEKLTLDAMAQAIPQLYDGGRQAGTDAFWDSLQNYGNRTDYRGCFMQSGFVHIDPKHFMRVTHADSMMTLATKLVSVNWDKFDLSNAGTLYSAFAFCEKLERIDTVLGVTNGTATLMNAVVRNCPALTSIQKIVALPVYVWKNSFDYCTALTHVIFDGTIGANGLNLQWSTGLDRESIESIINALSDTTSGLSITLSETAVINAFGNLTDDWTTVAGSKLNWTISLV